MRGTGEPHELVLAAILATENRSDDAAKIKAVLQQFRQRRFVFAGRGERYM